jgi:hypothetical protein
MVSRVRMQPTKVMLIKDRPGFFTCSPACLVYLGYRLLLCADNHSLAASARAAGGLGGQALRARYTRTSEHPAKGPVRVERHLTHIKQPTGPLSQINSSPNHWHNKCLPIAINTCGSGMNCTRKCWRSSSHSGQRHGEPASPFLLLSRLELNCKAWAEAD